MLVHCRVTPSIVFAGTHLYTWVERGTVRVKCLAQVHNTMSRPGLACPRLSVSKDNEKCSLATSNKQNLVEKEEVSFPHPLLFLPDPLTPCQLFQSSPLTQSLEQARTRLEPELLIAESSVLTTRPPCLPPTIQTRQ